MSRRTRARVSGPVEERPTEDEPWRASALRLPPRAWVPLGVILASLGIAAEAATVRGQTVDADLRSSIEGLSVGTELRVIGAGGVTRTGAFLGLDQRGLVLDEGTLRPVPVTPGEVFELSHRRSSWRKGMVSGGVVGAVLGTLAGVALAHLPCDSCRGPKNKGRITFGVGLAFAIAGSALGGAVGLGFQEWHPVYTRVGP